MISPATLSSPSDLGHGPVEVKALSVRYRGMIAVDALLPVGLIFATGRASLCLLGT